MTRSKWSFVAAAMLMIVALILGVLWLVDANSVDGHIQEDVPLGVSFTQEDESIPVAMVLASSVQPRVDCDKSCLERRNRVGDWRKHDDPIGTALGDVSFMQGAGCMGRKVTNVGWSDAMNERLFTIWQSVRFCWNVGDPKPGDFTATVWNQGVSQGTTAWWNYWEFRGYDNAVHGSGVNPAGWRYRYRRIAGTFETCFLGQCAWKYDHVSVAQTIRAGGPDPYESGIGH